MKGVAAAVIGLVALVVAPVPTFLVGGESADGSVLSPRVTITGETHMTASEAAFLSVGRFEGTLHTERLRVEVYAYERYDLHPGVLGFRFKLQESPEPEVHFFDDARVRVTGTAAGALYVAGAGSAVSVDLGNLTGLEVGASTSDWKFTSMGFRHAIEGPLLALKQDPAGALYRHSHMDGSTTGTIPTVHDIEFDFPEVVFHAARIEDPGTIALDDALAVVTVGGDRIEFEAGERTRETPAATWRDVTTVHLIPEGVARLTLDLDGTSAAVLGRGVALDVTGALAFADATGRLASASRAESFEDASLLVNGHVILQATPLLRAGNVVGEEAWMQMRARGSVQEARLDGVRTVPYSEPVLAPETKTLIESALAALIVLWTLTSKFVLSLIVRDPRDHPRRAAICEALARAGFLHTRALQREAGLPLASLTYHLAILRRSGDLRTIRHSNRQVHYLRSGPLAEADVARLACLTSDTAFELARVLVREGSATQSDLTRTLAQDRSTISRQLRKLTRCGLVTVSRGIERTYRPDHSLVVYFDRFGSSSSADRPEALMATHVDRRSDREPNPIGRGGAG